MRVYFLQRLALVLLASVSIFLLTTNRQLCVEQKFDDAIEIFLSVEDKDDSNSSLTTDVDDMEAINERLKRETDIDTQMNETDYSTEKPTEDYASDLLSSSQPATTSNLTTTEATDSDVKQIIEQAANENGTISTHLTFHSISSHMCVVMYAADIFGYGTMEMHSMSRSLMLPIFFLTMSIIFAFINMYQIYVSYTDLTRVQVAISNVVHIIFWATTTVSMFLHRSTWLSNWMHTNIEPAYPTEWIGIEILSIVIVVLLMLEIYAHEYSFYSLYIERSSGVYRIVESPSFKCSVYHDGLQQFTADV